MSAATPKLTAVVFRNIAAIGIARAGSILLDGVAYVLVARYLGPESYGAYVSVLAFLVLIDFAADLTLVDITVREMSQDVSRLGVWLSGATILRLGLAIVGLGAFGIYLYWGRNTISGEALEASWIAALILPVGALRVPLAAFRAGLKMEYELAVTILARALNLLMILAVVRFGGTLTHLFLTVLLTRTILGLSSWVLSYSVFRPKLSFDIASIRRLAREAVPMGLSGLFVAAQLKVDILAVSALSGSEAGGVYAVVAQLPEYFLYIPVVLTTPVLPLLSKFMAASDRARFQAMYQKLFDALMALILPVALTASLFAELVVTTLFGPAYAGAAAVLPILMASIVFMWFSHATAIAAVAAGQQRHFVWIQAICVAVYLFGNAIAISRWSFEGAVWVRLTATVIAPLLTLIVVKHAAGFGLNASVLLRTVLACAAMSIAITLVGPAHVVPAILIGFAVYVFALWATGAAPWSVPRQLEGQV